MCFSLGFITRETGFRQFRQLMCFWSSGKVSFYHRRGFCISSSPRILQVQDQGILYLSGLSGLPWSSIKDVRPQDWGLSSLVASLEGIHSSQRILQFLGWKPTCLLPCSRMLFSQFRTRELGLYESKAGSMSQDQDLGFLVWVHYKIGHRPNYLGRVRFYMKLRSSLSPQFKLCLFLFGTSV